MSGNSLNIKKNLIEYLWSKVKEKDLDMNVAKQFFRELGSSPSDVNEDIAIIGIACRFPDADTPDQFWENIAGGKDSIKPFPTKRMEDFNRIGVTEEKIRKAGFLESVDGFDAEYFVIPPKVALTMDPYQRMMLEVFIESIEDAGYHKKQIQGKNVGVFVGNDHTHRLYNSYISFVSDNDFSAITGSWTSVLASRISYLLNLKGPALVMDTGCSSALIALDSAIKAIKCGDCDSALVGAANLFFNPGAFNSEVQSDDYVVRTFDDRANGTVWGEGVAGVFIKPLSKAVRDNDHIYAAIKGIAVNCDGKTNGLTAPNARSQQDVIIKAWERAKIHPETLSYIESHGTGTKLGDPIEIKGLTDAFSKYSTKKQFCAIGSVKSNIGHTVGTAGLASLIKVVLAIREHTLPPNINFDYPNSYIDFCNSPVYLQDKLSPWESDKTPLRAGISSFSLSGINCHLVVEEFKHKIEAPEAMRLEIYVVSGRSQELLKRNVERHLEHFGQSKSEGWANVCYTAAMGREHQDIRVAFICGNCNALVEGMKIFLESLLDSDHISDKSYTSGNVTIVSSTNKSENMHNTQLNNKEESAHQLIQSISKGDIEKNAEVLKKIALAFVCGEDIDFKLLFDQKSVRRCSLPPQAFNNKRFWDERRVNINSSALNEDKEESTEEIIEYIRKKIIADGYLPEGYVASGQAAEVLAVIWSEVLGYPEIKPTDDFFALGGDSIMSLRIMQMISFVTGIELPLSLVLEHPVFSEFSRVIVQDYQFTGLLPQINEKLEKDSFIESDTPNNNKQPKELPLSSAQNSMFLSVYMAPDSIAYNITGISKKSGKQKADKIQQILQALINRHASLRSSFHMKDGKAVQVIHPEVTFEIEIKVLGEEPDEKERLKIMDRELSLFVRPFDISKAPLIRAGYFEFGEIESFVAIDVHHIVTDGLSMGVLFNEYKLLEGGKVLPKHNIGYEEAVTWLSNRKNDDLIKKQREWWLSRFDGELPILNLLSDKPRSNSRSYQGSRIFYDLEISLFNQLKAVAGGLGATTFMILCSAFYVLLARMSNEWDIIIGTPVTGRSRWEFQNLVGMFVNTLPLRIQANPEEGFLDFLRSQKELMIQAFHNQEYPYERLVEDLNLERRASRNPLFDVYFALQNIDMGLSENPDQFVTFDSKSAKFDLTVSVREMPGCLRMEWEYSTDLFYQETVQQIAKTYEQLLYAIVENPSTTLQELNIMEDAEKDKIFYQWSQIQCPPITNQSIIAEFENWVTSKGGSIALIMDEKCMSYNELNTRANQIAHAILSHGITKNKAIALLTYRSFDMIAAILGILKVGCHYVPMDLKNPRERLIMMMEDSDAELLITHLNMQNLFENLDCKFSVLDLDSIDEQSSDKNLPIVTTGEDKAYIMYTSGTTGLPKGTIIRHNSVIRVVKNNGYLQLEPSDTLLQLSNYSFDGSVFDIFGAVLNGASLVLLHENEVVDMSLLAKRIYDNHVSAFFITTALFNALVESCLECLDGVRKILFGGEAASKHHVRLAFEYLGANRLAHVYGPTESTVFAAAYHVDSFSEIEGFPIGRPIGNTNVYILDEKMQLSPIGVPGEVYIGGCGLAEGYLNQKELTEKSFVQNPFNKDQRLYKTGDIAVWKRDGLIYFLGRKDQQIKLRGFRIELEEIEKAALKDISIKEACAGIYVDKTGGKNLCMWVVLSDDTEKFDETHIRGNLEKWLPSYMIPVFLVQMEHLPINKNGKIEKKLLPPPVAKSISAMKQPEDDREATLVKIWKEVLGVNLGTRDNFFALGGDSIKAIQVVTRLGQLGLLIDMVDLFECQTIETLSHRIKIKPELMINQEDIVGKCTPNPIQKWFLNSGEDLGIRFNQAVMVYAPQRFIRERIEMALSKVCKHHDMLRASINEERELYIRPTNSQDLFYIEKAPILLSSDDEEAFLIDVQKHIDVNNGPLIAVALDLGEEKNRLFIAIHHIAVDVVSWGIILQDIMKSLNEPNCKLPLKTNSFSNWTSCMKKQASEGKWRNELGYWRELAEKSQDVMIIAPSGLSKRIDTSCIKIVLDGHTGEVLCNTAKRVYFAETIHVILSVLCRALNLWTGNEAFLVNLEGHGRERFEDTLDVTRTVGWFTSNYPVLLKHIDNIGDSIKTTKEMIRSIPNKGFGFSALRDLDDQLTSGDKELLESITPQINFNFLGMQNDAEVEYVPTNITVDEVFKTQWILDIIVLQIGNSIQIEMRYPSKVLSDERCEELVSHIYSVANEIAAYCAEDTQCEKTASDYIYARLNQKELEDIFDDLAVK